MSRAKEKMQDVREKKDDGDTMQGEQWVGFRFNVHGWLILVCVHIASLETTDMSCCQPTVAHCLPNMSTKYLHTWGIAFFTLLCPLHARVKVKFCAKKLNWRPVAL